ncbi:hypothetical protein Tco_1432561, partial [Tanacetum coccineum]
VMSSASSAVTYTFVYTNSEPGRVFWGADEEVSNSGSPRVIVLGYDGLPIQPVALLSSDYIPGPEEPQTPLVPHDEDKQDEHVFPVEEQPLPPIESPTAESPGYVIELDPEEDPEEYEDDETKDGQIDYPIEGGDDGDDDDGDSSRDDVDDKDKDEEGDEEEKGEHLAPTDSAASISLLPDVEVERLLAMPNPPPSPPISLSPPSAGERLEPPSLYIPPPVTIGSSKYEVGKSSTARPNGGRRVDYGFVRTLDAKERRRGISEVGYSIRDTWVDPTEAFPEIALVTLGEVSARVVELAELHEHDTQDIYALLEDAQDGLSQTIHHELQTHRDHMYAHETQIQAYQTQLQLSGTLIQTHHQVHETRSQIQQAEMAELREIDSRRQSQIVETLRVMRDMRREMGDMQAELLALREQQRRARQPAPDARVLDHQDASRDADSHI